jgi:ribosomal protein S18 acetylase RimI-like enzyme
VLVDRRYQNRGFGRIMLSRGLEILKQNGAKRIEIGVNRYNFAAQKLYSASDLSGLRSMSRACGCASIWIRRRIWTNSAISAGFVDTVARRDDLSSDVAGRCRTTGIQEEAVYGPKDLD